METAVREALVEFLRRVTGQGLFPVVAYDSPKSDPFAVLTTNIHDLPQAIGAYEEGAKREYNLGKYTARHLLEKLERENPHYFKLSAETIDELDCQPLREIGRVIFRFGFPYFRKKAFGLVDICGFSSLSKSEQLSQLHGLVNLDRQARARVRVFCSRLNASASFGKASTGDGFYFWNNDHGGNADVATFMLLLCIMDRSEWLRAAKGFPMCLRASFVIDEAFLLYDTQGGLSESEEADNAVGPATNAAARLIDAAKPSQILVGEFSRKGQSEEDIMTPQTVVDQANGLFREEQMGAASIGFGPDALLRIVDKHGVPWYCWNLCGQIPGSRDRGEVTQRIGLVIDLARDISDLSFRLQ